MPSLVLGPFGCGKTRILNECIKLLASHVAKARILICTHSNSATNLYVEYLHKEWNGVWGVGVNSVTLLVKECCKYIFVEQHLYILACGCFLLYLYSYYVVVLQFKFSTHVYIYIP